MPFLWITAAFLLTRKQGFRTQATLALSTALTIGLLLVITDTHLLSDTFPWFGPIAGLLAAATFLISFLTLQTTLLHRGKKRSSRLPNTPPSAP